MLKYREKGDGEEINRGDGEEINRGDGEEINRGDGKDRKGDGNRMREERVRGREMGRREMSRMVNEI